MMRNAREIDLADIEWHALIRPNDLVVWAQASAEPLGLTTSLVRARHSIGGFRAFVGISYGTSVDAAYTDCIAYSSYCGTGNNRTLGDRLDILPVHYGELARVIGAQSPVVLLSVGAGADEDYFSFGAGADFIADLIADARLVIAEFSPHVPRTSTGRDIARNQIDFIVETGLRLPAPVPVAPSDEEEKIASLIAGLIEDEATLQIGLGSLPAAILTALGSHRDLGFHSGLLTSEVAALIDAGIITNARKTIDQGISIAGLLSGGGSLMDWANGNKGLQLRPVSYTHSIEVIAGIDKFVALNSAIEVDLSGQVNAEVAGGRYVGAVGGAPAFMRGAAASRGGLGIIALPSTAKGRSRIVAQLSGPVSTPRCDVGLVVTEYGVADLRGASLAQRRDRLLAIAHPDHRAVLDATG